MRSKVFASDTIRFAHLVVLAAVSGPAIAFAEDRWPEFRGPQANGQSTAVGLPLTWSETENVKWKTPIPGKAWSSPVAWDGHIWVTNAPEDGKQMSAVCVDLATGRIVHDVVVFQPEKPQFCIAMNSYASPTPAIEEGRVYVHFGAHGTACLDTETAKTIWSRTDLECDHHRCPASSPVIIDDLLILTFDGFDVQYLVALDKTTGKTVWRTDRDIDYGSDNGDVKKAYSTPTLIEVNGVRQLISPSAGATIAYSPDDGKELWRVRSGGMNAAARPLYAHGLVYSTTAAGGWQLFAVDPTGRGDVTATHVAWKVPKGVPTRPSFLILGDLLFMVSDQGIATCVDARRGDVIWQERVSGAFSASPLYADGRIYLFREDGATPVIAPSRQFQLLATNKLDGGFMASPAVAGKSLVLRTKTHLYRIEQE
jgi:outer membrane protein assembly factor BamB